MEGEGEERGRGPAIFIAQAFAIAVVGTSPMGQEDQGEKEEVREEESPDTGARHCRAFHSQNIPLKKLKTVRCRIDVVYP